jgi:hypothetical protein
LLARESTQGEITRWATYEIVEGEWKAAAIEETLDCCDIKSALDVAGNKGAHILQVAGRNVTCVLLDLDENSLAIARSEAKKRGLPLFIGNLDICHPAPEWGKALSMASSFDRFRSDLVLALAVSHHLIYRSNLPFRIFARILDRYSLRYILVEYVDLADQHVRHWIERKGFRPCGYSESNFIQAFSRLQYQIKKRWQNPAGTRSLFLFEKL